MDHTVIAPFSAGQIQTVATDALFQWAYGQTLKFEGIELPTAYQVDFSNFEFNGDSITRVGGSAGVTVPVEVLATGAPVYAFVWIQTENAGRTQYRAMIRVIPRPVPEPGEPSPEEESAIAEAIAALNDAVDRTDASAEAAAGSAAAAADSADDAAESESNAADSERNAAASATAAGNSATAANNAAIRARESSETASLLADEAIEAASQARTSATAAAQSATNAANSATAAAASAAHADETAESMDIQAGIVIEEALQVALDTQATAASAAAAAQSETNAAASATSAAGSATSATGSATAAAGSATAAAASAASAAAAESLVENLVLVQTEEPTAEDNVLWIDSDGGEAFQVPSYSEFEDVKSAVDSVVYERVGVNIFPGYTEAGNLYNADGTENNTDAALNGYVRTDYIPIDSDKGTLFILRESGLWGMRLFFYDESEAFLSQTQVFAGSTTALSATAAIPANAAFFRTYRVNTTAAWVVLSYTAQTEYTPYGVNYSLKGPLYGKRIAFMGDSIIGNVYDNTGVCAILAEKTGAEVINCAFGGTRMGYRYGSNPQYPYWNALSGVALASAIASGTWTDQENAVENLTDGLVYFADRLAEIEAVDWTTVDFVMWEYGTNDFMTDVALSDAENPSNMYAFDNAYRSAIETILTAFPNLRIITATPMYRWYQSGGVFTDDSNTHVNTDYMGVDHKLTDFVAKAQAVSREYQIPCIDDYYTLGANKFTRLAYFSASDGTHPNANGRTRLAEHLAAQLTSIV